MKAASFILILAAMLFTAATAQAYAIYNHADYNACIKKWYSTGCHFTVDKHSTYNGGHGDALKSVYVTWNHNHTPYCSDEFSIPEGGYARIYNHVVKIYKHSGEHIKTVDILPDSGAVNKK